MPQGLPDHGLTGRDLVRLQQPGSNFGNRRIRVRCDMIADFFVQASQLARHVTLLGAGRGLAGIAPARENLGDVGDTDQQHRRHLSHRHAGVERRKHPFAQVLGLGPAPLPQHANLRW